MYPAQFAAPSLISVVLQQFTNGARVIIVHAIGRSDDGNTNFMAYQYCGGGCGPLPEWRCFHVSELGSVVRNKDAWRTASDHSRMNTRVARIDFQAG